MQFFSNPGRRQHLKNKRTSWNLREEKSRVAFWLAVRWTVPLPLTNQRRKTQNTWLRCWVSGTKTTAFPDGVCSLCWKIARDSTVKYFFKPLIKVGFCLHVLHVCLVMNLIVCYVEIKAAAHRVWRFKFFFFYIFCSRLRKHVSDIKTATYKSGIGLFIHLVTAIVSNAQMYEICILKRHKPLKLAVTPLFTNSPWMKGGGAGTGTVNHQHVWT